MSGECSFVVHLNENLYNVCGNFSWSFHRENLCRSCYEGLFRTHAYSFYVLNLNIFQVYEYNICRIVEQMLVEVRLSLLGRKVRFSVTFLWLKFLVFYFPVMQVSSTTQSWIPRNAITLKHETRDKYQSWKENNWIDPPIQRIK